jgi:hypothetical protein
VARASRQPGYYSKFAHAALQETVLEDYSDDPRSRKETMEVKDRSEWEKAELLSVHNCFSKKVFKLVKKSDYPQAYPIPIKQVQWSWKLDQE